jgi:hypothetical protein
MISKQNEPIIYEGATAGELCYLFNLSGPAVRQRLARLRPSGNRDGFDTWKVADAAIVLSRLEDDDLIERVLRLNAKDLPKALSREYWQGQLAKLTYEERKGELWDTRKIIELAGDVFKTMRLSLILLPDTLEREGQLNAAQRLIIERLVDELLDALRRKLVSGFEDRRDNKVGQPVASGEDDGAEDL